MSLFVSSVASVVGMQYIDYTHVRALFTPMIQDKK